MANKTRNSAKFSDYFIRLSLTMAGFIMVLSIVLTYVLYHNFRTTSMDAIESYERSAVVRSSHSLDEMTGIADMAASQLRANPIVTEMLHGEVSGALPRFSLPPDNNENVDFIDSVYFLNRSRGILYIYRNELESFPIHSSEIEPSLSFLNEADPHQPTPQIITDSEGNSHSVFSYVYEDGSDAAIVIHADAAWLVNKLSAYQDNGSHTFVTDENGTPLTGEPAFRDNEALLKEALSASSDSGSFTSNVNGTKYMISYAKNDPIVYIRVREYTATQIWIYNSTYFVLISVCALLVIGLLLAVVLSKRLSRPMTHMAHTIQRLENRNNVNQRALKQEFLNNLLVASHFSPREIGMKFADCHINISDHAPIFMILLKLDRWNDLCAEYNHADRSLLKYGVMNITEELISNRFVCDLVDPDGDSVVILCNYPSPTPSRREITEMLKEIRDSLSIHLSVSVTFCVGYTITDITHLASLYEDVKKAMEYRLYRGHGSVMFATDMESLDSADYVYPISKEKQLLDALMLGKTAKCAELYDEIVNGVRSYPCTTTLSTLRRLSMAINMALSANGSHEALLLESGSLLEYIDHAETIQEINDRYHSFFDHIAELKTEHKVKKYDDLLDRIHEFITNNYQDTNLSVNSISEIENRSPVYLGRLYKKLTGKSISESINEARIEEAKNLLSGTNLTVNEIVDRIGFSNSSYFYTVFKKHQGIAPNDFRQKSRHADNLPPAPGSPVPDEDAE